MGKIRHRTDFNQYFNQYFNRVVEKHLSAGRIQAAFRRQLDIKRLWERMVLRLTVVTDRFGDLIDGIWQVHVRPNWDPSRTQRRWSMTDERVYEMPETLFWRVRRYNILRTGYVTWPQRYIESVMDG